MSVAEGILEWAAGRPLWQQDALRRLLAQSTLTPEDIDELVAICGAVHGLTGPEIAPEPVAAEHFQTTGGEDRPVRLLEVGGLRRVNALSSDRPLSISAVGLTLVYGDNGAGKSGYVRALKQVCRARGGRPTILPDVYGDTGGEPAEAVIRFSVGDEEREFRWTGGADGPAELGEVSVFDHECASIYTDTRCEVAYLPFGLDLLPRLADACDEVRRRLDREIGDLDRSALELPESEEGSLRRRIFTSLDQPDAEERIARGVGFSEADEARLSDLQAQLREHDPERRSTGLEGMRARLRRFLEDLERLWELVDPDAVDQARAGLVRRGVARDGVEVASETAFSEGELPETGGDAWRQLWEAARAFWSSCDPDSEFPPVEGDPCPLCQQRLELKAADRFRRFAGFVRSEVQREAERAEEVVATYRTRLAGVARPDLEPIRADLAVEAPELLRDLDIAIPRILARHDALRSAESPGGLQELPPVDVAEVSDELRVLIVGLEERAASQRRMISAVNRAAATRTVRDLRERQSLSGMKEALLAEVRRRRRRSALVAARRDTSTTGVTRRNTELTEQYVTRALAERFEDELRALRLATIPVGVTGSGGERGSAFHQVQLEAARPVSPREVLSQGEQRCVALAAFLAELAVQESSSTVILDDPVSSLDQERRRHVADRLAEFAAGRPVLVFTHDIVFALDLQQASRAHDIPWKAVQIRRTARGPGGVVGDLPWEGLRTKERVGRLRALMQEATALHNRGDQDEYERRVKEIYGYLREGWERGVEEVLLSDAITRYGPAVRTQSLSKLHRLEERHLGELQAGMTKSSRWLRGHDDPAAVRDPVPDPDEVRADIEQLENWRKDLIALYRG